MRHNFTILSISALTLFFGCNKMNDPNYIQNPDGSITVSVSVSLAETKALAADGAKTFSAGDKLAVVYKQIGSDADVVAESAPLVSTDGKHAEFSVTFTNPDKTQSVTYVYPANMAKADGSINYDALKTGQNGTLAKISSDFDLCTKVVSWSGTTLPEGEALVNELTVAQFIFRDEVIAGDFGNITSSLTSLTVTNGTDIYSVTLSSNSTVWVAMKPITTGDIVFTATDGLNNYVKTVKGQQMFKGTLYSDITVSMAKNWISVSSNKKVIFAPGNLQYLGNADGSGTWRFAEHQYDFMGDGPNSGTDFKGNVEISGFTKYNASADMDVARDLFGWGASGYNDKYPYMTSKSSGSYYAGSLTDTDYDWGVYHSALGHSSEKITNGGNYSWRLFTSDEWAYVIQRTGRVYTRDDNPTYTQEKALYAAATVAGVKGIILFPDNWTGTLDRSIIYGGEGSYGSTVRNAETWAIFEKQGCVFLPAAHVRKEASFPSTYLNNGRYWAGTVQPYSNEYRGGTLEFSKTGTVTKTATNKQLRYFGQSVRLIRDIE